MKKIIALLLSSALILSLTACDSKAPASSSDASSSQVTTTVTTTEQTTTTAPETTTVTEEVSSDAPASAFPMTIKDQAGREVTINEKPEKLVSGYYISTSAMIALGLKDNLVGIEAKANKRPIYKFSAPSLIDLPNVGTAKEFDLEGCVALNPDLVILPIKLKSVVETLEGFGINVILVNPETENQLDEMIDIIASVTETKDKAEKLTEFTASVKAKLAEISDKPSVYLAGNSAVLSTAGAAMYQSDMIKTAGGKNVADEITDTYWAEISYEKLLSWNPDYIIIASDAEYGEEAILTDAELAEVNAVKNGNVFKLPSKAEAWDSPVPSGILGSLWVASKIHSDKITEAECNSLIDDFYSEFYGFKYSEKE